MAARGAISEERVSLPRHAEATEQAHAPRISRFLTSGRGILRRQPYSPSQLPIATRPTHASTAGTPKRAITATSPKRSRHVRGMNVTGSNGGSGCASHCAACSWQQKPSDDQPGRPSGVCRVTSRNTHAAWSASVHSRPQTGHRSSCSVTFALSGRPDDKPGLHARSRDNYSGVEESPCPTSLLSASASRYMAKSSGLRKAASTARRRDGLRPNFHEMPLGSSQPHRLS